MKVSGFTIVRNAVRFDYPVKEAILSILPLCDEFVVAVGNSDDDTFGLINSIGSGKIKIIRTVWDDTVRDGGRTFALETDKAFKAVSPDADWAFYIQADEVIHEKYHGAIRTAMVVDTDVHQGNGTAAIFGDDASVFTLSIHQENNYPMPKPPSDEDIGLADGTRDQEYLDALEKGLLRSLKKMTPDLIFYVGGADPYREDQLGGLALTFEGLQKRDRLVFEHARRRGIPVASTLAGGYARRVADTVRIHVNTIVAARDVALQAL